jgi:hypothetical protein
VLVGPLRVFRRDVRAQPDAARIDDRDSRRDRRQEDSLDRLMIVARLQPGKHEQAEALLRRGPPFQPEELDLHRHGVYLTSGEVVFFFEAPEVVWIIDDLVDNPMLSKAFEPWREIVEGPPRLAHERYYWSVSQ